MVKEATAPSNEGTFHELRYLGERYRRIQEWRKRGNRTVAVQQLLSTFNPETTQLKIDYCGTLKEQTMSGSVHTEFKHLSKTRYTNWNKVKKVVRKIIGNAWERVLKEETALKVLQVPASLNTPQGENEKCINDVRKAKIKAVHEELLSSVQRGDKKTNGGVLQKSQSKTDTNYGSSLL